MTLITTQGVYHRGGWSAWLWLMALPLAPGLAAWATEGYFSPASGLLLTALAAGGVAMAMGLPWLLCRLSPGLRKEVEQLRTAWIAAVFVSQAGLLPFFTGEGPGLLVFAATSAMLAAIPFGAEYQQRTLSSLLSQPVDRGEWWNRKMGVLAVAMGSHGILFAAAATAAPASVGTHAGFWAAIITVFLFATTPWWSLAGRGVLTGLVLSLVMPMAIAGTLIGVVQEVRRMPTIGLVWEELDPAGMLALDGILAAAGVGYAVLGFAGARRWWQRIEAPDPGFGEVEAGTWRAWEVTRFLTRGRRSVWVWLVAKELRLQTLPLVLAVGAIALCWVRDGAEPDGLVRGVTHVVMVLSALTSILLAGVLPIADERRLGTLDSQLIQPLSRRRQWWIKLLPGVLVVAAMTWVLVRALNDRALEPDERLGRVAGVCLTAFGLFVSGMLASSGTQHSLRAVVIALGVSALVAVIVALGMAVTGEVSARLTDGVYASAHADPQLWKDRATSIPAAHAAAMGLAAPDSWVGRGWMILVAALFVVPGVMALRSALANFKRPADAGSRLRRQFAWCLGVVLVVVIAWSGLMAYRVHDISTRDALATAWRTVEWERQLSPVDRVLWERYRRGPFDPFVDAVVEIREVGREPRRERRAYRVPLDAASRRYLIHRGDLPDDLRESLRQTGTANGEDLSPPPPDVRPEPSRGIRRVIAPEVPGSLAPGILHRYGLLPPFEAGAQGGPGAPVTSPPSTPESEETTHPRASRP